MSDKKLITQTSGKPGRLRNIVTKISDWVSPKKEEKEKVAERTWVDVMREFKVDPMPIDKHNLKIYYNKRLVGRVFPVKDEFGRDRYKLYIYYYKSDRTNKEGRVMKRLDPDEKIDAELRAQSEQPYWKEGKVDIKSEDLIWEWLSAWMYKTRTGAKRRVQLDTFSGDTASAEREPTDFSIIYKLNT